MVRITMIALILSGLICLAGIAYAFCLGPPYECTKCPDCGSMGTVFKTEQVGEGLIRTCLFYLKCWRGHVWVCAR